MQIRFRNIFQELGEKLYQCCRAAVKINRTRYRLILNEWRAYYSNMHFGHTSIPRCQFHRCAGRKPATPMIIVVVKFASHHGDIQCT